MTSSTKNKTPVLFAGILVILVIAIFLCWASTQPQALEDVKEITVTVAHSDAYVEEMERTYAPEEVEAHNPYILELETTAKTFIEALEPYALLELLEETDDMGEPVTVITRADEEYVDNYRGYAWVCYRNSELLEVPITELPIEDGDTFYFCITAQD